MYNTIIVNGLCPTTGEPCAISVICTKETALGAGGWSKREPHCTLRPCSNETGCYTCNLVRTALSTDCDKYFSTVRGEG